MTATSFEDADKLEGPNGIVGISLEILKPGINALWDNLLGRAEYA
jgi:hypothetical protein